MIAVRHYSRIDDQVVDTIGSWSEAGRVRSIDGAGVARIGCEQEAMNVLPRPCFGVTCNHMIHMGSSRTSGGTESNMHALRCDRPARAVTRNPLR